MRISPLLIATFAITAAPAFGQSAQAGGAVQSSTSADASRGGASISSESSSHTTVTSRQATASAGGDSEISATLVKPVDARKAKPGDPVTAKTNRDAKAADGTTIKRGSTLVGHITQASSVSGSADSTLGIVFDKAVSKDGHEVPLSSSIRAIGAAQTESGLETNSIGATAAGSGSAARGGLGGIAGSATGAVGGLGRGVGGSVGATAAGAGGLATRSPGAIGGLTTAGALQSGSRGVFGLDGLSINNDSSGGVQGSVIRSSTHNVRLDGGTKMLLTNSVQAPGGGTANVAGEATGAAAVNSSASRPSDAAAKERSPVQNRQ